MQDTKKTNRGLGWVVLIILFFATVPQILSLRGQVVDTTPTEEQIAARAELGGSQTRDDILRRQRGEPVDLSFRKDAVGNPDSAAGISAQLGTLGGVSDAETLRAMRYGTADVTVSTGKSEDRVLMQDGGMKWLTFRDGPLQKYGGRLLLFTLALLAIFFLIRGRIRIDAGPSEFAILRFRAVERFGHWLLAGSFILLGITGLISLFGRKFVIPMFGHEAFAVIAVSSKWIHNNVSWAFMLALCWIFALWVFHNIPNRHDLKWLAQGGGMFSDAHPPARKFNAGQKLIFWSVIVLGVSISVSGLSLLFPFEMPMFAATFAKMNAILGTSLPVALAPHEEMQYAQLWHSIVAFVFIAIIFAHIYLGSVGMEGAYDAMGKGDVDLNWAKEHHGLWVEEELEFARQDAARSQAPAE